MPPAVAKAVVAVMSGMETLVKKEENDHAKYKFVGIDSFLTAVRPKCAEAGLIIVPDEESCEVRDSWLLIRYAFTVAHESGETWEHRPVRNITVNAKMGSQAFGTAQSYAMKQFMRSLFQISTGDDEDADNHEQGALPQSQKQTSNNQQAVHIEVPPQPGSISVPSSDRMGDVWKAWSTAFARVIDNTSSVDEVNAWLNLNKTPLHGLASFSDAGRKWATALHGKMDKRRHFLAQAPAGGDAPANGNPPTDTGNPIEDETPF